ncbi:MAG: hypothetical protein GY855_06920 [candidate division Zixibacteria bacterium]|nr:hypothetical protein [candidate division Zixibacteria bacterium]
MSLRILSILIIILLSQNGIVNAADSKGKLSITRLMSEEFINVDDENPNIDFDYTWNEPEESQTAKKSGLKAGALSLILPGAGAYYLDRKSRAAVFFGTEAAIWSGYFAFKVWGNWKEDEYKSYAAEHASANVKDKDVKFFERMQFYESRDWFNIIEGLRFGEAYPYTDFYYWHWDNDQSWKKYRDIRNSSRQADRNADFMVGVALLNRVVSFVDALRLASKINKARDIEFYGSWKLDYKGNPFGGNPSASISLIRTFN